jgi:hypothetical protein
MVVEEEAAAVFFQRRRLEVTCDPIGFLDV